MVRTCTFKGVHYEMFVDTDSGNELMIQDYNAFEPGTTVGMHIHPGDIQVMKKERVANTYSGTVTGEGKVEFLGAEWECRTDGFQEGEEVEVSVAFGKVDLLDHEDDAVTVGNVVFILYKGDHYHLTVKTEDGEKIWVDTTDVWDKNDFVGIRILPKDIRLSKAQKKDE